MDNIRTFFINLLGIENVIKIVGIVVATILAYSGIKNNDVSQALNAIIAMLGSLAVAQVIAGYVDTKTKKSIEHIEALIKSPTVFFKTRGELDVVKPFNEFLAQGHDILCVGTSLIGTVAPFREFIKTLVLQGVSLRFLLLDPESSYLEFAARFHGVSTESLRKDINATITHLHQLVSIIGKSKRGSIQFRLLKTIPNGSFIMRDSKKSNGEIRCELYLYQTDVTERPIFCLTHADGSFYQGYRESIERLWNDSRYIESNNPK